MAVVDRSEGNPTAKPPESVFGRLPYDAAQHLCQGVLGSGYIDMAQGHDWTGRASGCHV